MMFTAWTESDSGASEDRFMDWSLGPMDWSTGDSLGSVEYGRRPGELGGPSCCSCDGIRSGYAVEYAVSES